MPTASIDVSVKFTTPPPQPTDPPQPGSPATASDTVDIGQGTSLGGSASKSGATTDKTIPAPGGSDQTQQRQPIPNNGTFQGAAITAKLSNCPNGSSPSLTLRANVSVSARVEGNCIVLTAVSEDRDDVSGRMTTRTRTRRICCDDATVVTSDPD